MHMQKISQLFDKFWERIFFRTLKQTVTSSKSELVKSMLTLYISLRHHLQWG